MFFPLSSSDIAHISFLFCALTDTATDGTLGDMASRRQKIFRIGVADSRIIKAGRDRISGIMRYASTRPDWEVRLIAQSGVSHTANETIDYRNLDGLICGVERFLLYRNNLPPHLPVVIFDTKASATPPARIGGCLTLDDAAIGEAAAATFLKSGLRHLAFIGVHSAYEHPYQNARLTAFRRIALNAGAPCDAFVPPPRQNEIDDLQDMAEWLVRLPYPCGVMAYSDNRAQTVLDACRLAHLRVPEQIQLVGVDNEIEICENMQPTLTSILPDFEQGGFLAAQLLGDILSHRIRPRKPVCRAYGVKTIVVRASTQDLKGGGRIVSQAREFIRLHAHERITVADIAASLNLARRTLENRFREVLGCGVADVLREERINRVARLLRETDRTISSIAYDSGFSSPTHLCALFRATYGMTMKEWRAS